MMYRSTESGHVNLCGLGAGSWSVNSRGGWWSQRHPLSAEWHHHVSLTHSMPERILLSTISQVDLELIRRKVFDQGEMEPKPHSRAGPGIADLKMTDSIACDLQREGALWYTRSVDGMLCCWCCWFSGFILWQRGKEFVTAGLLKPANTWEFPE